MTSITTNYTDNNLSLTNNNSNPPARSGIVSKISNLTHKLYLGPGYTNVPGLSNLFYVPYDAYESCVASIKAYQIGDKEGVIENGLRIAGAPFTFSNAALQLTFYGVQAGIYLKVLSQSLATSLAPLSSKISGAGIAFSLIEGILESLGIKRSRRFLIDNYPFNLESLKKSFEIQDPLLRQQKISVCLEQVLNTSLPDQLKEDIDNLLKRNDLTQTEFCQLSEHLLKQIELNVYLNHLSQLQKKYFEIKPKKAHKIDAYIQTHLSQHSPEEKQKRKELIIQANLEKKKSCLIRRVQHWMTNDLEQKIPGLIQDLQSPLSQKRQEAIEGAAGLFNNIRIQSHKNLLINAIGLAAVIASIAGLILGLAACPYFIPFALLAFGGVLSFLRYYLHLGLLETQGWHFDPKRCIPAFVKSINKKLFQKEEKTPALPLIIPAGIVLHLDLPRKYERTTTPRYTRRRLDYTITIKA